MAATILEPFADTQPSSHLSLPRLLNSRILWWSAVCREIHIFSLVDRSLQQRTFWQLGYCSERLTEQGVKSVFLVQDTPSLHDLGDAEFSLVLHEVLFHLFATRANALARGTFLFWSDSRLLQNALNVFLGVMWSPEKFWLKRYRWDPPLSDFLACASC